MRVPHQDKPSRTAYKVAACVVSLANKPGMDKILPAGSAEASAELLIASGAVSERMVRWSQSPRMLKVYDAFDWMIPGQFEAIAHRKAFCEGQVRDGIADGATQVLVLGAGYDTLCWRLASEFPLVNFIEIDLPSTGQLKAKGITAMGCRDNLYLIPADLSGKKLSAVLTDQPAWDRSAVTVIVAEGLLMYLPPAAVRELFEQCATVSGAGSRLAFSYVPTRPDGRPDAGHLTGLVLWLQEVFKEPWLFSIRPEELGPFLKELGWTLPVAAEESNRRYGVEYFVAAIREGSNT